MARTKSFDELDDQPKTSGKPRRRRASFFGFLSVLTGIAALAVVYRDQISAAASSRYVPGVDLAQLTQYLYQVEQYPVQAYHVAAAGALLAVLALGWRKVSKRTRAGWPVLGLLVCGAAAGIYRYNSVERIPGTPEHWMQVNVVERVQKMLDKKPAPEPTVDVSTPESTPESAPEVSEDPAPPSAPEPAVTPAPKEEGSKLFPES